MRWVGFGMVAGAGTPGGGVLLPSKSIGSIAVSVVFVIGICMCSVVPSVVSTSKVGETVLNADDARYVCALLIGPFPELVPFPKLVPFLPFLELVEGDEGFEGVEGNWRFVVGTFQRCELSCGVVLDIAATRVISTSVIATAHRDARNRQGKVCCVGAQ